MVINVITRKASGLPSTLIELHVVVHVVVTLVVYGLWWNKPLSVQSSIILNPGADDNAEPRLPKEGQVNLEMLMLYYQILLPDERDGPLAHTVRFDYDSIGKWAPRYFHSRMHWFFKLFNWNPNVETLNAVDNHHTHTDLLDYDIPTRDQPDVTLKILVSKGVSDANRKDRLKEKIANITQLSASRPRGLLILPGELVFGESSDKTILFASHGRSPSDVSFVDDNYIRLLTKVSLHYHNTIGHLDSKSNSVPQVINSSYYNTDPSNIGSQHTIIDWSKSGDGSMTGMARVEIICVVIILLGFVYAGCHATAWNSHFPTFAERSFWRGACIVISCGGPTLILFFYINLLYNWMVNKYGRDNWKTIVSSLPLSLFLVFGTLLYCLARGYIVVEAFISVRSLPAGAYKSVDWIDFWPHM
jgi:hypothetical protein